MFQVARKHHGGKKYKNYPVYTQAEADAEGIKYKPWKESEEGGWLLSDDGFVAQVFKRRTYTPRDGRIRDYLEAPFGRIFWGKNQKIKFTAGDRDFRVNYNGTLTTKRTGCGQTEKDFVTSYALTMDSDLATEMVMGTPTKSALMSNRRLVKTERFRTMLRDELKALLSENGVTEKFVIDLMYETIEMAKTKKDVTNLMRAVENCQRMLGMAEPQKERVVNTIEATRTTRTLVDKLHEEEDKLKLTQEVKQDVQRLAEPEVDPEVAGEGAEEASETAAA